MTRMTDCPVCGSEISDLAMACPWCGFPMVLYTSMRDRREDWAGNPFELVAMNPHTPQVMLDVLSEDGNPSVRASLARNPQVPPELLLYLADDKDDEVRAALCSSPFLSIDVMEKLANDEALSVIEALYQNPAVPEYLQRVLEDRLVSATGKSFFVVEYDDVNEDEDDDINDDDVADDDYEESESRFEYDDYSPYGGNYIEHDGKRYDVMDLSEYGGETMYYDEDNGWLTELP